MVAKTTALFPARMMRAGKFSLFFYCDFCLYILACFSHFESAAKDVLSLYERLTGTQLDMTISADSTQEEDM